MGLLALVTAGCVNASANEPPATGPPTSITENESVLIPPLVIEHPTVPQAATTAPVAPLEPTNCLDGSEWHPPTLIDLDGACVWTEQSLRALEAIVFSDTDAARMARDITRESGWNQRALGVQVCRRGRCYRAKGLAQLLGWDGLAAQMGHPDLFEPYSNLVVAREVLRRQGWRAWATDRG